MLKQKLIISAGMILLVSTLLLGVGAIYLLKGEQVRLIEQQRLSVLEQTRSIATSIDLAITEVEDSLMGSLEQLSQRDLISQLDRWKLSNPLVRNVFVWTMDQGLVFPDPERPASDEEAAFVRRYLTLLSDRSSWISSAAAEDHIEVETALSNAVQQRRELVSLARKAPAKTSSYTPGSDAPAAAVVDAKRSAGHWRSWYADDHLHLLGWVSSLDDKQRYGLELEMMAVLSRLTGLLAQDSDAITFALIDGNGDIFHQVGRVEIDAHSEALAAIAIEHLPHWRLNAYASNERAVSTHNIRWLGGLLVVSFCLAILLGGSTLLWQAWRSQRDARQKTSFVSNVSHELKTPLTTIRMYAELLGEQKISDPEKQQRYLQTVIKESQRLTRLVNNVLDFSRLEQGQRRYRSEMIDLNAFIEEIFRQQGPRLRDAGMAASHDVSEAEVLVDSDPDALEQIVLNLLDNAIKYAAEGGQLTSRIVNDGRAIRWQLCDCGPGIPPSHARRIFDKFHRVDSSLTSKQQGTGLGLSIARQLARGLGGDLSYHSLAEGGCCFELHLPQRDQ